MPERKCELDAFAGDHAAPTQLTEAHLTERSLALANDLVAQAVTIGTHQCDAIEFTQLFDRVPHRRGLRRDRDNLSRAELAALWTKHRDVDHDIRDNEH